MEGLMQRVPIGDAELAAALAREPAPPGYSWQLDPAASGDRLRLFEEPNGGPIGAAYGDGRWFAEAKTGEAQGNEPDLARAMWRMVRVARALGAVR